MADGADVARATAAAIEDGVEAGALWATSQFYKLAKVLFAPNDELCRMLEKTTGRPCYLMQRGVDTEWFSPAHRTREADDKTVVLGYVGRLSVEKNVALLARVERELAAMGVRGVRFLIVGHGSEEASLRRDLMEAEFAGVLRGAALARGLREYGCAGVSVAYGYVWECGAGGAGEWGAGGGDSGWWTEVYCAGRGDGICN